jgi:hypothetical protein
LQIVEPLVRKLSEQQRRYWNLEYEDLCQMCRLVISVLYNKGYYLHKSVISKAFINHVLMHIRKEKYKPTILSLDETIANDNDGNSVNVGDLVIDELAEQELNGILDVEASDTVLQEKRDIVIERIGKRQYDQLVREYGNQLTTNVSRKKVHELKSYLLKIGISENLFNGKY